MQATRRRISSPVWLGLSLVVGLPALAEAQLFPNRTITRQKEACAAEPPFYSTVRRNYFGYYPTCWSKFPEGWGCPCPNPELPNRVASFSDQPRDPFQPTGANADPEGMPGDDSAPPLDSKPTDDSAMPPVPNPSGRSPFSSEPTPPEANPRPTLPDPSVPPRTSGTTPSTNRPIGNPTTSSTDSSASASALGLLEMPPITSPTVPSATESAPNSGSLAMAPDATLTSTETVGRPKQSSTSNTIPPMPDPAPPVGPGLVGDPAFGSNALPVQAPQRRGLLGGIFNKSKRKL